MILKLKLKNFRKGVNVMEKTEIALATKNPVLYATFGLFGMTIIIAIFEITVAQVGDLIMVYQLEIFRVLVIATWIKRTFTILSEGLKRNGLD